MVDLTGAEVAFERRVAPGTRATFAVPGARRVVATWSGGATPVTLLARFADGGAEERFVLDGGTAEERRSESRRGLRARVAVDELRAEVPLASVTLEAPEAFSHAAVARSRRPAETVAAASHPEPDAACELAVRPRSQYEEPGIALPPALAASRRGWCAPTALAMLLDAAGIPLPTRAVAAGVFDAAYGGTGNWSFAAGFADRLGFGAVAYLRDLAHARRFVAAGLPLALSFAWAPQALPGAPLGESAGHLAVLRGFDERGDPRFADPAQPAMVATYPYRAFEAAWLAHGGVALLAGRAADAGRFATLANVAGGTPL